MEEEIGSEKKPTPLSVQNTPYASKPKKSFYKIYFILGGLVLLLLIVIGMVFFVVGRNVPFESQNLKYGKIIISENIFKEYTKVCDSLSSYDQKRCYSFSGEISGDIRFCEYNGSISEKCIEQVALLNNNPELCKKLERPANCYNILAINNNDSKLCELYIKEEIEECKRRLEGYDEKNREGHISNFGECKDRDIGSKCYTYIASNTGNKELCESIKSMSEKKNCFEFFIEDVKGCNSTSCFTRFAIENKDPELCQSNYCLQLVAVEFNNISICQKIKGWNREKESCLIEFNVTSEFCDTLKDRKDECYFKLAKIEKNAQYCSNIRNNTGDPIFNPPLSAQTCYYHFALELMNKSLCQKILSEIECKWKVDILSIENNKLNRSITTLRNY
jgi:hypothetical protein